ncbi:MAG TPA: RDD family protein [Anaerolineae bacterium]|jgi:uncharacterized RDD family membrane protein YckC|nr:RDD family protein [Anaerolineae bacterium]
MWDDLGEHGLRGQYAGFVSRMLAFGIDIVVIVVMLIALGWLVDTVTTLFPPVLIDLESIYQIAIAGVVVVVTSAIYYLFFWTLTGQTPGKMLLGIRVVSLDGSGLTLWQALRRFIGYFLSALAIYVGYLWVLIDNRRQGWHDKLAGTIVVYAWDARLGDLMAERIHGSQEESEEP